MMEESDWNHDNDLKMWQSLQILKLLLKDKNGY